MLTREEIAEIVQYCKENGVTYKSRLKEIGISEWRFYESKRRYGTCADKQESRQRQEVGIRVHTDEHRDAHADRDGIADPGQSGRGYSTGNNPGVVEPCLA